eukprot:CAMPEP_0176487324 /NCGR_PEP_ID=MMETSP0200_2-20121128/6062_1 /TAXON_ID=947934 /ORGANISM="Chaetoceros sp., Strain GSL56" /LENGTH=890 /DNA_ID=CAMNT_0017884127 /DNA_START=337 /DNA_END=3006 /DNA_ORIENTATION=+
MSSREILQQFLCAISYFGDDDRRKCKGLGGNAASDINNLNQLTNCMSENGIQLYIPCLDVKPEGTDQRPYEIPFPTAVLKLLMNQNNLQCLYKRNTKDLSSEKQKTPDNFVPGSSITDNEKNTGLLDCKEKEAFKRNYRKEAIQSRISRTLEFNIPCIKDKNDGTFILSTDIQTIHSNLKETIKILVYEMLLSLTAKTLYKSIAINGMIDAQTAKNLAGSLPSSHDLYTELTDHMTVSKSLESWIPPSLDQQYSKKTFVSEEEDAQIVTKSLQKYEPPSFPDNTHSREKKFSSEEDDAQLVVDSLRAYSSSCNNTCTGGCTLKGRNQSASNETHHDECIHPAHHGVTSLSYLQNFDCNGDANKNMSTFNSSLNHIAAIKTIHKEKSIKDALYAAAIDSTRIEASNRLVKISIKKYSNVFASESDSEVDVLGGSIDLTRVTVPMKMDCKVVIQIGSYNVDMEFQASGIIKGNFDSQSSNLKEVNLRLNDKELVENLIQETCRAIKTLIGSNKTSLEALELRTKERSHVHPNGDHLEAAHALSQISASPILQNGKKKVSSDMSPKRNVKRVRIDSMDLKSSSQGPCRRRSRMSSLDVVTEAIRMTEDCNTRKYSDINNHDRETWFHQPNFGGVSDTEMGRGSFRRGSESMGNDVSSAASFLRCESGTYNMAAAAEAVRLLDAGHNLNSLANLYQMDSSFHGSINGSLFSSPNPSTMGRRPSYSGNTISQSAQDGKMQNFWGGEGFTLPSSAYIGSTGAESQSMNQGLWVDNWYSNAISMNPETNLTSTIQAENRRRSSLTDALRLVEMEALRRNSANMSMAAAADVVRLSEMNNALMNNQRRQSFAPTATEQFLTHSDSFDNLAAMMRRGSGPNGSMASAANAVSLAELENW